ncbi:interferon-induced very large GTPase 1-like [Lampris incognitus]|uniref:interferon-induced very large GTPase 1-like n=1 Tax=Lampris incognitus TaxID=2546036 RepID=UPI0024B5E1C9|nr:interferon-induced very large GTPase 1-like [Lampris incognitus]
MFSSLTPGVEYCFHVSTQLKNGTLSKSVMTSAHTKPNPPEKMHVSQVTNDSLSLSWDTPAGEVWGYIISCSCDGKTAQELTTQSNNYTLSALTPGVEYCFHVSTQLKNGILSKSAVTSAHTELSPPEKIQVSQVTSDAVTLNWDTPAGEVGQYILSCSCDGKTVQEMTTHSNSHTFFGLTPGVEYCFHVFTQLKNGIQSKSVVTSAHTNPNPPEKIKVSLVTSDSVCLSWDTPAGEVWGYSVSCSCDGKTVEEITTHSNSHTFLSLTPGVEYFFHISAELKNGILSKSVVTSAHTKPPSPEKIEVSQVTSNSVSLSWDITACELGIYNVSCSCDGKTVQEMTTHSNTHTFSSLTPGVEYCFHVSTQLENGILSKSVMTSVHTKPNPPDKIQVSQVTSDSVSLSWDTPAGEVGGYRVSCSCDGETLQEMTTHSNSHMFSSLAPGVEYCFHVSTQLQNGFQSKSVVTSAHTKPISPEKIQVSHVTSNSVSLSWDIPAGEVGSYTVRCSCDGKTVQEMTTHSNSHTFSSLTSGVEYCFHVSTQLKNGMQSKSVVTSVHTEPNPPQNIQLSEITRDSVSLSWDTPAGEVGSYRVSCSCEGKTVQETITHSNSHMFSNLTLGVEYCFHVFTQLKNGILSKAVVTAMHTNTHLESLLEDLGLQQHYPGKLSLSDVLKIEEKTITDESAVCRSDLPWCFLKRLMMVNVTAMNVKCTVVSEENCEVFSQSTDLEFDDMVKNPNPCDKMNPLDIVTALFLCSNGILQQEIALKMSMCQFSVPLLLPNSDTHQCTLMLWAMRDIVKKYRPLSLLENKGFTEERIVSSEFPMVSFVRLGECSLSKSEILNKLLSNSQQYHDTFVHRDMECGDSPKKISDGLVEISWYLPCGNKNIDVFTEPIAVANLRGDIASLEKQYSFLCQASAAVFVFLDSIHYKYMLTGQHNKGNIFLVCNVKSKSFSFEALKKVAAELNLKKSNVILKNNLMNDADFVKNLRNIVRDVVNNTETKMQVEQMANIAYELNILVDEDSPECKKAKQNADAITGEIQDILKYKNDQLPLQGTIWKELTLLEKEECRLKKAGDQHIETYKSNLLEEKRKLWQRQNDYDISNAMTCFIQAISSPGLERSYFLKWMRINLDNLSREKLCGLREQYKQKCLNSENKEEIKDLDLQLSNSSLGIEHFLREMGQLYECAASLPETEASRQQLQHLPRLCAELLLDGFPVELVDGDASNIPMRWVADVLFQLSDIVNPKNKILVITVLGVQSTGKSTLLNTMFGVQFAVSSGRCTRGAFMLLIKVEEDFKKVMNCDFLMIIDTEGLKSPELAQLDDSYEHDHELATLVVGLSDITIINIAMENLTEMKDILQIVVHAFLRMKEVGKKPKCQFVHQNVSDVSAHDKNVRDRKLLLQQLDEMTQAAARMEKKEENKNFSDVMEYNPDTGNAYIPGLWHGNPPMAPVNAGYSEAVYELKKNIIKILGEHESSANEVLDFLEWTKSLWAAVKHENFIFSFRNSLVADAYMMLCSEFHKWEWEFKKHMYAWVTTAEISIANFDTKAANSGESDMGDFLSRLKSDALSELSKEETVILENLTQYFKQSECNVHLVERYKEDFSNSAKSLRRRLESSVLSQVEAAAEIRLGMVKLYKIREDHTSTLEVKVLQLIDECRKNKAGMTDKKLDKEFDRMWKKTVTELSLTGLKTNDIFALVEIQLRRNLFQKGSYANELLNQTSLHECGKEPFIFTPDGIFRRVFSFLNNQAVQKMADSIITVCKAAVSGIVQRKNNFHDNNILEILHLIDERLNNNKHLKFNIDFEVSLKLHICGMAAPDFQKMHDDFIKQNDPLKCLSQHKDKYRADFNDLFHQRDQCQKKAEEFTKSCLKPAVEAYVCSSLGPDIVDEMLTGNNSAQFSTRMFFQYSILKDLLSELKFEHYLSYICSYEDFVKEWIFEQIVKKFSSGSKMCELEHRSLKKSIDNITEAIKNVQLGKSSNLVEFVNEIRIELGSKLVIPQDAFEAFMILNNANHEQFAHYLVVFVEEMKEGLHESFKQRVIREKLENLSMNPQNELFTKLIGCGKQCPFCKAPCEAGGEAHTEHWASIHRPQGLGQYTWEDSKKLVTDICSSAVNSEMKFRCHATNDQWHPYKKYRDFFPDWNIPPDSSIEASDYWKYVMTKFNNDFAQNYDAKPADIPPVWQSIKSDSADKSLKVSFSIK